MLEFLHRKHLVHSCGPFGNVGALFYFVINSCCSYGICMWQACGSSIFHDPFKHDTALAAHFKYNKHAANAVKELYGIILFNRWFVWKSNFAS